MTSSKKGQKWKEFEARMQADDDLPASMLARSLGCSEAQESVEKFQVVHLSMADIVRVASDPGVTGKRSRAGHKTSHQSPWTSGSSSHALSHTLPFNVADFVRAIGHVASQTVYLYCRATRVELEKSSPQVIKQTVLNKGKFQGPLKPKVAMPKSYREDREVQRHLESEYGTC